MKKLCSVSDLIPNSGVCALSGNTQIALFYIPSSEKKIFAIGNWDPIGGANVMSRGIVGSIDDELVVASPLYKQHFSLLSGKCLEDSEASVSTFDVSIDGEDVLLAA